MKNSVNKKQEIKQEISFYLDLYEFEGEINIVADKIKNIPKKLLEQNSFIQANPKLFHRFELKIESDYESYDVKLIGVRLESDEELAKRIEKNRVSLLGKRKADKLKKEKQEKEEKELFQKLSKKYGKKFNL